MYNAVKKFLALYHHLTLPGIGNFTVETIPARIDIAERKILPSLDKINFNTENISLEKKFYNFLSEELNVDETQAVRSFTRFVDDIKADLLNNREIVLKGIGKLTQTSNNELNFDADNLPNYYPELTAERIIRKNATHTIRVGEDEKSSVEMHETLQVKETIVRKERWWIAAIILAVIGIAMIAYYYLVLHPVQSY